MSYSNPETPSTSGCCSSSPAASAELNLYQAFIFSVPIFFTFILLFLFYLFYLRRQRVDWSSLRMRTSLQDNNGISRPELGLKKELREMLPIIVYKESFSVRDTLCSVCLGEYEAEDRLQQIPACGHTFHMDCIDHWLATHTTCPLCRFSLLSSPKPPTEASDIHVETTQSSDLESGVETSLQHRPRACEETEAMQAFESRNGDATILRDDTEEDEISSQCGDRERGLRDGRNETDGHTHR